MAVPVFEKKFVQDIRQPVRVRRCGDLMFTGDSKADTIYVEVYNDGAPYNLTGTVTLNCIRADGATVAVTGSISGNVAQATLAQACCAISGPLAVVMKITSGDVTSTILKAVYTVDVGVTGTTVDPGTIVNNVNTLIAAIETAVESIPADYSDLLAAIAPTYSNASTYAVGDYVWYDGDLYRCTTAIPTAESWTAAHWETAVVGDDITELKSALAEKLDAPSTAGTAGQALVTDGNGGVSWDDVEIEVDATLSQSGEAADAKATGDEIAELKSAVDKEAFSVESDASGVDLDVTDEDGNVIVRFKDGHIQTKKFDSAGIEVDQDVSYVVTNDDSSDLLIIDEIGNVIFRIKDGYIQTKSFDSSIVKTDAENATQAIHTINGVDYYKQFTYTGGTASVVSITGDFKKGDTILCHYSNMEDTLKDLTLNNKAAYYYIDSTNKEVLLGQEYAYNFARFILPEDTAEIKASFPSSLFVSGSYTSRFYVYKLGEYEREPHIITVSPDGSKQFTSIRDAMDSITDNNAYNTYEIWVYPGTYNIMDDFTDEEIETEGFKGLFVKNGVTIIGVGHREEIVLHGELDPDEYTNTIRNQISTLNMAGNCGLKNITVTNNYLRYAVHDDSASATYQEQTHIIDNCRFESRSAASGGAGEVGYGSGGCSNKKIIIRNCDLGERLIIHNTDDMNTPMTVIVENSTAKIVTITDNDSPNAPTRVEFNNCNFAFIRYMMAEDHTPSMILTGQGTYDVMFDIGSIINHIVLPNFGDCVKFPGTIASGQAVTVTNQMQASATTDRNLIYGICIGNDGTDSLVQTRGYLTSSMVGLTGLSVGDYVTIDSSGVLTATGATASNAVGVVICVSQYSSCAFIKLTI